MANKVWQIGTIEQRVIDLLNLTDVQAGTPIMVGETNIDHMKSEHPDDYAKYGDQLENIVDSPTYVAEHPSNGSIQYIKVFEENDDFVLVAVRITRTGKLFTRTLFVMADDKVRQYKQHNALKEY